MPVKVFIRERRMERHMTQVELAKMLVKENGCPVSQSELSKYEKGKTAISLDIVLQISQILEFPVEKLVNRE